MKPIWSALLVPVMACLMAFTPVEIPPEGRMKLSAISDKILLVEITKVTFTDEKVTDGIANRDIHVEGKVLEVIRGNESEKHFNASWGIFHVVNSETALAKHGEQAMDMLSSGSTKTGIEDCKEGKQFVVITLAIEPHFVLFHEVPKDNNEWRMEIRPRVDPSKPTKLPGKTTK